MAIKSTNMTEEEFNNIPFTMTCHLNMCDEHCSTYVSTNPFLNLGMCIHVPYKDGKPFGRSYTHYMWNGKVYKSKKKLIDDMNKIK